MLFSFIIPCYNASKYLPKLFNELDSYQLEKAQAEVVFIDDGSSDNTLALLHQYCERTANARVILNSSHAGVSLGRNRGIEEARGKWLIFLDCDDKYSANVLPELTAAIRDYPEHDLFMFRLLFDFEINGKVKHYHEASYPDHKIATDKQGRFKFNLRTNTKVMRSAARMAFKRELIMKHNLRFDANVEYGEDLLFHWHYLIAMEKEQAIPTDSQEYPLEGIFVPSISYYYFQASNKAQRDTDIKSKNQALILGKALSAFRSLADHADVSFDFCKHIALFTGNILVQDNGTNSARNLIFFYQELQAWLRIIKEHKFENQMVEVVRYNYDFRRANICYMLFFLAIIKNPELLTKTIALLEQMEATYHAWDNADTQNSIGDEHIQELIKFASAPELLASQIEPPYLPIIQGLVSWKNGRKYLQIITNTPELLNLLSLNPQQLIQEKAEYILGITIGKSFLLDLSTMSLIKQAKLLAQLEKLIKHNNVEPRHFLKLIPSKAVLGNNFESLEFNQQAQELIKQLNAGKVTDKLKAVIPDSSFELKQLNINLNNAYFSRKQTYLYQKIFDQYQFRYSSGIIAKLSELTQPNYLFDKLKKRYPLVEMIFFADIEIPLALYFRITAMPNLRIVFTKPEDFTQFAQNLVKICLPPQGKPSNEQVEFAYQILRHCYCTSFSQN